MQILAGLALLAVLIVFHELGHFLLAKALGVKVLVFSVGFGPKLFSFNIGETEYRLSAIPLGGYVRMFGESLEEELSAEEKKISFMHQAIWRKSLIAAAGPIFNFILPIILFFGLFVGTEQIFLPRIGTVLPGGSAEAAGLLPDDRILAIDGKKIESFSEMAEIIGKNHDKTLQLGIERLNDQGEKSFLTKLVKPEAKDAGNPLEKDQKVGRIGIMPAIEQAKIIIHPKSPFKNTELLDFDEVIEINGKAIASAWALENALDELWPGSEIKIKRQEGETFKELIVKTPNIPLQALSEGLIVEKNHLENEVLSEEVLAKIKQTKELFKALEKQRVKKWGLSSAKAHVVEVKADSLAEKIGLKAQERIIALSAEPVYSSVHMQQLLLQNPSEPKVLGVQNSDGNLVVHVFKLPADWQENLKLDADLASVFGLTLPAIFTPGEMAQRNVGVFEALSRASEQTYAIFMMTAKSIWMLVSGDVPASSVGGPIQLFDMAKQAADKGLAYYIFVMCLLSVNLGLLNLLPIPALDGGHLLLFSIEAIQRKPLTPKTRMIATQLGFAVLLSVMALAIFNDISRLFR